MEAAERERLTADYVGAWNAHDPDAVAAFFAPSATYDDRGAGELVTGRPAIRAHVAAVMSGFPDLRFETTRVAHGEGFSAGEWRAWMTHGGSFLGLPATGRRAESSGVDVATLDANDLISHLASYYDGAALMRDLGLLPRRGSRAERALLRLASIKRLRF
jgi:steroid delta-isomerase-like uncharacterized protein